MRGRGPGWWKQPRRHREAALKGRENSRGRMRSCIPRDRVGKSSKGMFTTEWKVKKVKVGRKEYAIPVDESGKVPEEAIVARYLNVYDGDRQGRKRNIFIDSTVDANVKVPANSAPEEIAEWRCVRSHFITTALRDGKVLYERSA